VVKKDGFKYIEWTDLDRYADGHHGLENVIRVISDAAGKIVIPEGAEPATLVIRTDGYARRIVTPAQRPKPLNAGPLEIPLTRAASIQGVAARGSRLVRRSNGVGLHYIAKDGFDHMFHGLKLDEYGTCEIGSLPAGDYVLYLMHGDSNWSAPSWTKTITLAAGQELRVTLGEMTGSLTFSARTVPFTQVHLTAMPAQLANDADPVKLPSGVTSVAMISDIDGYFEFDHVEPGQYKIELGDRFSHDVRLMTGKGPKEILLAEDTHVDFVTGSVTRESQKK
jgi:hypothetical protein